MSKGYLKKMYYSLFKKHPYAYLGRIFLPFMPEGVIQKCYADYFVDNSRGINRIFQNALKYAIADKYYRLEDADRKVANRRLFWGANGSSYHDFKKGMFSDSARFENDFLKLRLPLVEAIIASINGERFLKLCEIGCGNGILLDYLSKSVVRIPLFTGLDLNGETVRKCSAQYGANKRLEFRNMEVMDYIKSFLKEPTVFVAYDTLKYFTEGEIENALRAIISSTQRTIFAMAEPVLNMDFNKDVKSSPMSFTAYSHNYPRLFERCGYGIRSFDIKPIDAKSSYSLIYMIAKSGKGK